MKSKIESKTLQGLAVTILGALAGIFGVAVSPENIELVVQAVSVVIVAIGSHRAYKGRINATETLK